jgi:tripartite-type tricarboxylate transporter receptor subunit TctC
MTMLRIGSIIIVLSTRKFNARFNLLRSIATVTLILVTLSGHGAWSQTTRTIKLIVPFPPGGGVDIVARLLAEYVSREKGQAMLVENRPGAGSVIGTEAVSRAAPDGNTLLVHGNSFIITSILKKLSYDPLTSFEPICDLVRTSQVLAVNSASPYRSLSDLLAAARAKPGELILASVGPGTTQHIAFEMLKRVANVDMNFVPYSGNAPAVNALLGGHVTSVMVNYPEVAEQIAAGKLRALATASRARDVLLPDVPTVAEFGFKDYEAETWNGVVAPKNTPKQTLTRLASWFSTALKVPEIKSKLVTLGLFPVGICGADYAAYLRTQYDQYTRVIHEADIKAE